MKGQSSVGTLALIGVVVLGLAVVGGIGPFSAASGPGAAGGDDDSVASLYLKAEDALASQANTYANVSYEIEGPDGVIVAEGETDTSSGFAQISNLDENTDYAVRMYDDDGTDDDFYFSEQTVTTNEGVKRIVQDVQKEGSATTEVFETAGDNDDDTIPVSQGATETFDVEVKENTQNAVFRQPALVVKTNDTAAVPELEVSGSTASEVPDRLSTYNDLFDTGTAEIVDFNKEEYTVQVTRGESNSDTATVDVAVVDLAHYKNDAGNWVEGYEDSDDNDVGAEDANIATQTITTP